MSSEKPKKPKPKLTVHVDTLKELANEILESDHEVSDFRRGVVKLLETALIQSGQYAGFDYLGQTRDDQDRIVIPDETRRRYH